MEFKDILISVLLSSFVKGQGLLSIKPEVFIEGQPGNVTCTYNNQPRTFLIYGSISDTLSITTCNVQSQSTCVVSPLSLDYSQYYNLSNTTNSITIHINTVNRTRDGGQWRCIVYSSSGENKDNITIDVKVPVSSVEITNKNIDLVKDSTANLECIATGGYPLPNITWSIGTIILTTSVNTFTSSLRYQPAVSDQGQRLQCSATNGYGQSQSDSFQLDIKYKPVVDIKPSITSYKLIQGQIVLLECQVTQSNPVVTSYRWYNGSNIITGSSSTYTVSNDGSYSCSATNSVGESDRSRVISVEILYPPTVSTPKSPYSIIEFNTLMLPCIATSNPVPNSYTWSGPNNLLQSQQNLTIPSINRDQTGLYTCTVTNIIQITGGQQTVTGNSSTTVNVLYGPVVSISSVETKIKENENLKINCTVTSNPPTNDIVWYQSNGNIVPNQFVVNGINRRDLVINDINRSKSDNYTCTARLDLHPTVGDILPQTHSQSSTINVQYFDDIDITTNQTKLKENDAVFITCSVDSNPSASIKWFKDGDVELPTSNSNIYFISSTSCLDTGNYSCLATNHPVYINQKTKSLNLFVHCLPRLDSRENYKPNVSGVIGATIKLKADIVSYPGADFQWFYKDNGGDIMIGNQEPFLIINTNRFINSFRSVLRINITSKEMYRHYFLNVTNGDGLSNIVQFQLISETVPGGSHNINVRNITSDTICIEWTPGFNGGASQSFIVQHSTDDKTWVNSSRIPDDTNNGRVDYCIEGLKPDTSYYIRVIASNKYGESQLGIYTENGEKKPIQTSAKEIKATGGGDGSNVCDDRFGAGIGTGLGIALAILAVVVIVIFLYKYRQGKRKKPDPTYDSVGSRATADSQTYQELNTVRNTDTPQASDAAQYYNLRADQNRTDREDTRPYANV